MNLDKIREIIRRKPTFFIIASLIYILSTAALHWGKSPNLDTLLYILGGMLGIVFLDIAEVFFQLNPSPFRSMLFFAAFIGVSFFIVSSSGSALAGGLVLSLYLTLLIWQIGEWRLQSSLNSWYRMIALPIDHTVQRNILIGTIIIFFIETLVFVR